MLKIERSNQIIHITLKRRERLWSPSFILAFSIALLLHLAAFLLIAVKPIIVKGEVVILAPVSVNASITAIAEFTTAEPIYPFEPHPPAPVFPTLSLPLIEHQEIPYPFPLEIPLNAASTKPPPPFRIVVSGPLAEEILILPNIQIPPIQERYAVRVDNLTGRVIWHQSEKKEPNPAAENFLDQLCFIGEREEAVTMGTIEIEVS